MTHSRERQLRTPFSPETLQLMSSYDRRKLLQNIGYVDQLLKINQWQTLKNMRDRAIKRAQENLSRTQSVKIKNQLYLAYILRVLEKHEAKRH